ncbi:MAG: DUF58 domain-containing protein [Aureliella sp.]
MNDAEQAIQSLQEWGVTSWAILLIFLVPLVLLMLLFRVFPTRTACLGAAAVFLLALPIPIVGGDYWLVPAVVAVLITIVSSLDLLSLPRIRNVEAQRSMQRVASLGTPHPIELSIENGSSRPLQLLIADDASDGLQVEPNSHRLRVAPHQRATVSHTVTATRRGAFALDTIYIQALSLLRFWRQEHRLPCENDLHVYPDIKQIAKYALLARTNRLSQIGVRRTRKIGQDNEFERLRDYTQDDNYKHIDWRTTARRQKLTVKQFQTDQSQRVIFLLDCGRMMTNEYERLSLLDYALNSILMLGYVALDQGDSVGMLSFSDEVHTYVPPAGGRRQMNRLLHAGFNEFPRMVQSRFDKAFLYLSQHCRKRSLVVLVTNVIDQVNAEQIQSYVRNLGKGHLPLLVLLRDHRIFEFADNPAEDPEVMYRSAAASQLLLWRNQVLTRMKADGALSLDVFPEAMTSPLVNSYLEVKARHLL